MNKLFCLLVVLLAGAPAQAHPGSGIVQDGRGNIFFTDLKQVWKITPDGQKSVAVPNVHTHELCLDAADNLYGEHLWYEGETTNKWRHRVWSLNRAGMVSEVIPTRAGFLRDYSFVRDRAGNMYWAEGEGQSVIKKRAPDGKITIHARADFRDVSRLTATADGQLFVIDGGDLRHIAPDGRVTTTVAQLSGHRSAPAVAHRHYHMGIWTDGAGSVYVAVAGERLVLKVQIDGRSQIVARSSGDWSPSGGILDRDGNLWLLEYSSTNAVRTRRIARNGSERIF